MSKYLVYIDNKYIMVDDYDLTIKRASITLGGELGNYNEVSILSTVSLKNEIVIIKKLYDVEKDVAARLIKSQKKLNDEFNSLIHNVAYHGTTGDIIL